MARARGECARSPFSVIKRAGSEEDVLNRIMGLRQPAASAAGRSSWTKHPRRQIAVKREHVNCRFHGLATGSEPSHAASHLAPVASLQAVAGTRYEPSLSSVGQVRPLQLEK